MDNENLLNELEDLRAGYAALKEKMEAQEIVNDKIIRNAMKARVSNLKRFTAIEVACALFVIIFAPLIFHYNPVVNASWWFIGGTFLMMFACLYFEWKYSHKIYNSDLANCDMLEFVKNVKYTKDRYQNWKKWGFALAFVWVTWLIAEIFFHSTEMKMSIAMAGGVLVGLVLGGCLGLKMLNGYVRNCDEIIKEIEG